MEANLHKQRTIAEAMAELEKIKPHFEEKRKALAQKVNAWQEKLMAFEVVHEELLAAFDAVRAYLRTVENLAQAAGEPVPKLEELKAGAFPCSLSTHEIGVDRIPSLIAARRQAPITWPRYFNLHLTILGPAIFKPMRAVGEKMRKVISGES